MHKIKTIKIEIRLEIPEFNFEIETVSSGICFCDEMTHMLLCCICQQKLRSVPSLVSISRIA